MMLNRGKSVTSRLAPKTHVRTWDQRIEMIIQGEIKGLQRCRRGIKQVLQNCETLGVAAGRLKFPRLYLLPPDVANSQII